MPPGPLPRRDQPPPHTRPLETAGLQPGAPAPPPGPPGPAPRPTPDLEGRLPLEPGSAAETCPGFQSQPQARGAGKTGNDERTALRSSPRFKASRFRGHKCRPSPSLRPTGGGGSGRRLGARPSHFSDVKRVAWRRRPSFLGALGQLACSASRGDPRGKTQAGAVPKWRPRRAGSWR